MGDTFGRGGTTHSLCVMIPGFSGSVCSAGDALGASVGHGLPIDGIDAGEAIATNWRSY
jgi:hypothetical protein